MRGAAAAAVALLCALVCVSVQAHAHAHGARSVHDAQQQQQQQQQQQRVLSVAVDAEGVVVHAPCGPVRGVLEDGVAVFRGVPFARPPVDQLRFAPPQPAPDWTDTLDCTHQRPICPQFRFTSFLTLGAEDCLYLDLYVPASALTNGSSPVPVMFWIFGGAYVMGDGYEFGLYDGRNVARTRNVIIVAANYRLSALGFLALRELAAETPTGTTGNYALQDQRTALEWVQRNVHAFGGRADQVTIYGESAGAFSVCYHVASPASRGLFRAAIMESGTCDSREFFVPLADTDSFSADLMASFGCNRTAIGSASKFLACIRALKVEDMMTSMFGWLDGKWPIPGSGFRPPIGPVMSFGVTIDGAADGLLDVPLRLIRKGVGSDVPLIIGTNKNEGSIFVPMMLLVVPGVKLPLTEDDVTKVLLHFFDNNATIASQVLEQYPVSEYKDNDHRAATLLRDYFFVCSGRRVAAALTQRGQSVHVYHFTYGGDWVEYPVLGDYHSAELEFVFDNPWPPFVHHFSKKDEAVADAFGSFWTNMAHSLSPNGGPWPTQLVWPAFDAASQQNVVIDAPLALQEDLQRGQCDFWDTVAVH